MLLNWVRRYSTLACRLGIAVCFIAFSDLKAAQSNLITAASTASTDVQAAINQASDGATVVVPAGSATWTVQVEVPTAITLQGAGIGQTIIRSSVQGAVFINNDGNGEARVTGFTFDGGGAANMGPVALQNPEVRMDHCLFTNCDLYCCSLYGYLGVIDHCTFVESDAGIWVNNGSFNNNSEGHGDGSWTSGDNWGTTNFAVIENCTFDGDGQNGAMDGCAGARWVFRYNYVSNDVLVAHGTDSSGRDRGTRAVEVYDNTFASSGGFAEVLELRSGTAVMYSNTATGYNGEIVDLKNDRSPSCGNPDGYPPPWGPCLDGTNVWDGNTDTNGYPAIDQCGRGTGDLIQDDSNGNPYDTVTGKPSSPHEASDPVYEWGNTVNGADAQVGSCGGLFVEGRDYFTDVVKPSYTALVYPHPLDTTAGSSTATFTLTVVNGSGGGSYSSNSVVSISANTVSNEVFTNWIGTHLANTNLASTTVTMPASNITVTANYAPLPPTNLKVTPLP